MQPAAELSVATADGAGGIAQAPVTVTPELVRGGSLQLDAAAVVVSVLVRLNSAAEFVGAFKAEQHAKKDDSNLSVALCCTLAAAEASESGEVLAVRGFVGGVSQAPAELPLAGLIGSVLDEGAMLATATSGDGGGQAGVLRAVGDAMAELTAAADAHPGGRVGYRRVLCCVFVLRFLLRTARAAAGNAGAGGGGGHVAAAVTSAIEGIPTDVPIAGVEGKNTRWLCDAFFFN